LPGSGLVARSGELLLVCADGATGVEELLGLVAEVADSGGDGSVLVRRVAALLAADFSGRYPACAVSGPTTDGRLAVLVNGSALATVAGGEGEVVLSGADAVTSVNRLIPGPIASVRLELPGAGPANPYARLQAGVITAAGVEVGDDAVGVAPSPSSPAYPAPTFTDPAPVQAGAPAVESLPAADAQPEPAEWSPAPSAAMAPPPAWPPAPEPPVPAPFTMPPPPPEPPAFTAPSWAPEVSAQAAGEDGPAFREPSAGSPFVSVPFTESDGSPAPAAPAPDGRPTVLGLVCVHGHLTDPSLEACVVCGASMAGQTAVLREGPRPPLGAMLLDDGSTYVLEADYLLGREPQTDPEVISGTVRPLKITDAEGVVSRKHVRVALVGWDIQVIDLGSANGTFLQTPEDGQPRQLSAHQPVVVRAGAQVTMGRRWFRVEALSPRS
jgi:hypothetical protein